MAVNHTMIISFAWWFRPALRLLVLFGRTRVIAPDKISAAAKRLVDVAARVKSMPHITVTLPLLLIVLMLAGCGVPGHEPCRTVTSAVLGGVVLNVPGAIIGGVIAHETDIEIGRSWFCD